MKSWRRQSHMIAFRWPQRIRFTLSYLGTTGQPKGVVRDNGGHAVALKWTMKNIYGVDPGDVFWAASDLGWAVGHSYIVYGPLLHGIRPSFTKANPSARLTRERSGASLRSTK